VTNPAESKSLARRSMTVRYFVPVGFLLLALLFAADQLLQRALAAR
jgi:hypothetical protein